VELFLDPPRAIQPRLLARTNPMSENKTKSDHAEEAAAEGREGQADEHPQDGTDSTTWDTDQHSDAPGPFGTG
jgi:hypothetical protein